MVAMVSLFSAPWHMECSRRDVFATVNVRPYGVAELVHSIHHATVESNRFGHQNGITNVVFQAQRNLLTGTQCNQEPKKHININY
eukprot:1877451-Amphidinium_carterae.1